MDTTAALSEALVAVRDAVTRLQAEDLHGVDSGSLLTDVVNLRRLADQVEGEWLRRVGRSTPAEPLTSWVLGRRRRSCAGRAWCPRPRRRRRWPPPVP